MINQNDTVALANMGEFIDKHSNELYNAKSARLSVFLVFDHCDEELFKKLVREGKYEIHDTGHCIHAENSKVRLMFYPKYEEKVNPESARIMKELKG